MSQQLPSGLRKLLNAAKERLESEEAAQRRAKIAQQERERQAALASWQSLVSIAQSDLGPDLTAFVNWVLPEAWTASVRERVIEIHLPGLAEIRALYSREEDGTWIRAYWKVQNKAGLWQVARWHTTTCEDREEVVQLHDTFTDDLPLAMALADKHETERRQLVEQVNRRAAMSRERWLSQFEGAAPGALPQPVCVSPAPAECRKPTPAELGLLRAFEEYLLELAARFG